MRYYICKVQLDQTNRIDNQVLH